MRFCISPVIDNENTRETLFFAAEELQAYLSAVSGNSFSIVVSDEYNARPNTIYIGTHLSDCVPVVDNPGLDDGIFIDIKNFSGVITGTNARAVLIAIYRYLKELGFAFLRPGKDGEYFPDSFEFKDVYVCEKASYRHRAVCIEGSVSRETLRDMIDWLPKVAMNGYFIQFQLPRVFFERWYMYDTPYRQKQEISDEYIYAIVSEAEEEIRKRSLLYHAAGHGWTSQAIGIQGTSWDSHAEPDEEFIDMLALVNGKRTLYNGIPLNTNLCYSNDKVRNCITDNIVSYCAAHPDVSYLHFWLADGNNNNCECNDCRGRRTSDYYIQMLNELDRKLTERNIGTRIVFLVYFDLLWKPLYEYLENIDRFVLMFAPISRSYTLPFDPYSEGKMTPYKLNNLSFPANADDNLAYLKDWQKDFKCDSFDFDYHFMWDHYYDFAQYNHAYVLWEDIKNLKALGLNGFVSCQIQRAFLPTSVNMNILAETLWNSKTDFDKTVSKVIKTEFGEHSDDIITYLSSLSDTGMAKALRGEDDLISEAAVCRLTCAINTIDGFAGVIREQISRLSDSRYIGAWEKLEFHNGLYRKMLEFYLAYARGNGIQSYEDIKDFVQKNEMRFKDEFDAMYFLETFENHIVRNLRNGTKYNY